MSMSPPWKTASQASICCTTSGRRMPWVSDMTAMGWDSIVLPPHERGGTDAVPLHSPGAPLSAFFFIVPSFHRNIKVGARKIFMGTRKGNVHSYAVLISMRIRLIRGTERTGDKLLLNRRPSLPPLFPSSLPGLPSVLHQDMLPLRQRIPGQRAALQVFPVHVHRGNLAVPVCGVIIDAPVRVAA